MTCRPQFALLMATALALGGCVTLPLPPVQTSNAQPGDWGSIKVMITYVPNISNLVNSYKEWRKPEQ